MIGSPKGIQNHEQPSNIYLCDEIMVKILEYLPIRDKVEMVSVFEQFDRCLTTVRLSQKRLFYQLSDTALVSDISQYMRSCANESQQKHKLVKVFETFPNVRSLWCFDRMFFHNELKLKPEWVLQMITRYYPLLESIQFNFKGISDTSIIRFAETIGPKLKDLLIVRQNDYQNNPNQQLTSLFKRTISLKCLYLKREEPDILFEANDIELKAVIKNLSDLWIEKGIDRTKLSAIIDANPELESLDVKLFSDNQIESSSVIKNLSQLKRLKNLEFVFNGSDGEYTTQLADAFGYLAINLKSLYYFYLRVKHIRKLDTNYLLSQFKNFSNLKELHIELDVVSKNSQTHNFEWLKTCHQLIDLRLFSKVSIFTDSISQIPLYSPKLQILWLFTKIKVNITDNDLEYLAQLKHLKELGFSSGADSRYSLTDTGIVGLIDGCSDLQTLKIHQIVSITSKVIRKMVEKANGNPKKIFHFDFGAIDVSEIKDIYCGHIFDRIKEYPNHTREIYEVDIGRQLKISIDSLKNLNITGINFSEIIE